MPLIWFLQLINQLLAPIPQLEGTWQRMHVKDLQLEEWKTIDSVTMEGRMYKVQGSDTLIMENIRLAEEDGILIYQASPQKQGEQGRVSFRLTKKEHNTYVFENPEHDFPRRIIYQFTATDALHAWIDDGTEQQTNRIHFYFKKIR